ncbi:MAG: ankyrin repeat domain-containing protein [Campylobacterota bacterium]|nr:ankyrin repeat domain-containing protein [Campylobacterota bacterium]
MLNKFLNKVSLTFENLTEIVLTTPFQSDDAKKIVDSNKVNINEKNEKGETLLHLAIKKNKLKAAKWLVEHGIKTNIEDKSGMNDILLAVERGDVSVVDALYKQDKSNILITNSERTLLQDAALAGQLRIFRYLLNTPIDINSQDKLKRTVIFDAISFGERDIINEVISQKNINLNIQDINGKTVLHDQKVLNNDDLAKQLLIHGADPTICDEEGNNFITYTALRGEAGEAVLDTAIESGFDINKKVLNDLTIVMEVMLDFIKTDHNNKARRSALKKVAKKLINNKADINSLKDNGESILFDMIHHNDYDGCAFLMENGADSNIKNNAQETPLYLSIIRGQLYFDITMLMIKYGANPTLTNKGDKTIPEVLNEIILHTSNLKTLEDKDLMSKINDEDDYRRILQQILSLKKFNYNYFDSNGDPLFYSPFYNGDIKTSQLYMQNGFDINMLNKDKLNLFYQYVDHIFAEGKDVTDFKEKIVFLIVNKADVKVKNPAGQTIFTKVSLIPDCNLKLFSKLKSVVKYDYKSKDNMGRTIMHCCVTSNNLELLRLIFGIDREVQNIPDSLNVLPVTYAALFGNKQMVIEFLKRDSIIKSPKAIHILAKKKFKPLLKNITKLTEGIDDVDLLKKIKTLQEQVVKDIAS